MIIWGWGRVTRKVIGPVFQKTCNYCNSTSIWQLCVIRTWFTLFFIPIIPYGKRYCIVCPNCGSYIKLTKQQFNEMKAGINSAQSNIDSNSIEDNLKYQGKTEIQINYLKQIEEQKNKENNL